MPVPEKTSMNEWAASEVSISTTLSSSLPSRRSFRRLSRVPLSAGGVAGASAPIEGSGSAAPRGRARRGRPRARRRRQQHVQQALLGVLARARPHALALLLAQHRDRRLGEVAHHRVDVAADVADLGELRGLDLHERRARQLRQPARDLRLAHAGGADEHDVLGRDLVAHGRRHLLAAPAVAQRHGDGALGRALPDDVAVELLDDGARGEVRHLLRRLRRHAHSSSKARAPFV
jgi:hypothetical protein